MTSRWAEVRVGFNKTFGDCRIGYEAPLTSLHIFVIMMKRWCRIWSYPAMVKNILINPGVQIRIQIIVEEDCAMCIFQLAYKNQVSRSNSFWVTHGHTNTQTDPNALLSQFPMGATVTILPSKEHPRWQQTKKPLANRGSTYNILTFNVIIVSTEAKNIYIIPKNYSSYLFTFNTFSVGHLVQDEKASLPRIFYMLVPCL